MCRRAEEDPSPFPRETAPVLAACAPPPLRRPGRTTRQRAPVERRRVGAREREAGTGVERPSSRHGAAGHAGRAHLGEHAVQPLQGPVEVQLHPARGGGHCLAPVLGTPALDEAHPDGAHARQLVHCLKAARHGRRQQGRKLLVVEDLQVASWRRSERREWLGRIGLSDRCVRFKRRIQLG